MEKAINISGIFQENGDFIFYIKEDSYRKMVLSSNSGAVLTAGYLPLKAKDWKNSKKWRYATWYRIVNFRGVSGKKNTFMVSGRGYVTEH